MFKNKLLSITVDIKNRQEIFKRVEKNINQEKKFLHIVSLNPEILVIAQKNDEFKKVLSQSDIQLCDGIGTYLACKFLNIPCGERIAGVDLMEQLLHNFNERSLCVVLIGGRGELATSLANCYNEKYSRSKFIGLEGYNDVNDPTEVEEKHVLDVISEYKPDIIFAAFGAPAQELWFDRHRAQMCHSVCMSVGGGFDFLGGTVARAPSFIRTFGLEWLYRLFTQPWRAKRQVRLIQFVYLVLQQKLQNIV
ncbi:WecB/TagA/CpsF family glycosyltransferase [soil metagenome]